MEDILRHLGGENLINNGINYQPQLVSRICSINGTSRFWTNTTLQLTDQGSLLEAHTSAHSRIGQELPRVLAQIETRRQTLIPIEYLYIYDKKHGCSNSCPLTSLVLQVFCDRCSWVHDITRVMIQNSDLHWMYFSTSHPRAESYHTQLMGLVCIDVHFYGF